jgi:hypothetical protein
MLGRKGDAVESIRERIAIPPETQEALTLYTRRHPEDAFGIERVLAFRKSVGENFERLVESHKVCRVSFWGQFPGSATFKLFHTERCHPYVLCSTEWH